MRAPGRACRGRSIWWTWLAGAAVDAAPAAADDSAPAAAVDDAVPDVGAAAVPC